MAAERDSEKVACDMTVAALAVTALAVTGSCHRRRSAVAHIIAVRRTPIQRSAVSLGRRIPENGSDGLGAEADFSYWQCYEDPVFGKLAFREVWPSKDRPLGGPVFLKLRSHSSTG
jgi:hypothetical protein